MQNPDTYQSLVYEIASHVGTEHFLVKPHPRGQYDAFDDTISVYSDTCPFELAVADGTMEDKTLLSYYSTACVSESFYLTAAAGSSSCIRWQAIPLTKSAITKIIFTHYAVCTTIFILHIQKKSFGSCCPDHSLQSSFYRFYMPSTTASSVWSSASLLFHGFSITPATSASRATSNNCWMSARNVDFTAPPPFISSSKRSKCRKPSSAVFCPDRGKLQVLLLCHSLNSYNYLSVFPHPSAQQCQCMCQLLIRRCFPQFSDRFFYFIVSCNPRSILVPFCFHSMQFILNNMRVHFIYSALR